jgi:1,4-alpha-glucan branching enzyme
MWAHPGKKLLFMGGEFGQPGEWNHEASLDWHLLDQPGHRGLHQWIRDLNRTYRSQPALWRADFTHEGFQWVNHADWEQSCVSFLRMAGDEQLLIACNFTPVPRHNYIVGVPRSGFWREILNSDAAEYGGGGMGNIGGVQSSPVPAHGQFHSLAVTLPPLSVLYFEGPGRHD